MVNMWLCVLGGDTAGKIWGLLFAQKVNASSLLEQSWDLWEEAKVPLD